MRNLACIKLGLAPNQATLFSFLLGSAAVIAILADRIEIALFVLAAAMLFGKVEGGTKRFEKGLGALNEIMLFFALALMGYAEIKTAALASFAVILIRTIQEKSGFDPKLRRAVLFLGYFTSFELALEIIFFANITAFAIGTIMTDYALQKKNDGLIICLLVVALAGGMRSAKAEEGKNLILEWVNFNKDGIAASVRNEGGEIVENIDMRSRWIRCGAAGTCASLGESLEWKIEGPLKSGEERLITIDNSPDLKSWLAGQPFGVGRVRISIDPKNKIQEIREDDNVWEEGPISPRTSGKTLAERDAAAIKIEGRAPRILPESGLYMFKDAWMNAKIFFTFDRGKKAEKHLARAKERLLEIAASVEAGNENGVQSIIEIKRVVNDFEKARGNIVKLRRENASKATELEAQELGARVRAALVLEERETLLIDLARRMFELKENKIAWEAARNEIRKRNTSPFFALRGLKFTEDIQRYYPGTKSEELMGEERALIKMFEMRMRYTPEDIQEGAAEYIASIVSREDSTALLVERIMNIQKESSGKEGEAARRVLEKVAREIRGEVKEKIEEKSIEKAKEKSPKDETGTGGGVIPKPKTEEETSPTKTEQMICTAEFAPVCGKDDVTYGNECEAIKAGAEIGAKGACELPPPDLKIQNTGVSPTETKEGDWIRIEARVFNEGGSVQEKFHARLRIDADRNGIYDVLPPEYPLGLVRTSSSVAIAWENVWQAEEGVHRAEICADSGKKIAESNELNNCAILAFPVGPAPTSTLKVSTSTATSTP